MSIFKNSFLIKFSTHILLLHVIIDSLKRSRIFGKSQLECRYTAKVIKRFN
jgi:hypothetical protein